MARAAYTITCVHYYVHVHTPVPIVHAYIFEVVKYTHIITIFKNNTHMYIHMHAYYIT